MIDNDKTLPFSLGNLRESMFENIGDSIDENLG